MDNLEHEQTEDDPLEKDTEDAEEYLRKKAKVSVGKTVEDILNNSEVQSIINRVVIKQSIESGFFLSFLIIGILTIANAMKEIMGVTWQGDLAIGLTLISIGGVYMIRKLRPRK